MSTTGDMDKLWESNIGAGRWLDKAPDEQREWLDRLVVLIVDKGSEPVWSKVGPKFRNEFGLDKSPADGTISNVVRLLVEQS